MRKFVLIGRPHGPIFDVVKSYKALGDVPAVKGLSECGRKETFAREVDVVFLPQQEAA